MSNQASVEETPGSASGDRRVTNRPLFLFLRFVAAVTLLAFAAAIMPESWIVKASISLGFDPFPRSPLTFYLARHLSLIYGMLGVGLWIVTSDMHRYRPLIRCLAPGALALGVGQLIIDAQSGLPYWWTLGESISTMIGAVLIWWLDAPTRRAEIE